jgi:hypothetical protein
MKLIIDASFPRRLMMLSKYAMLGFHAWWVVLAVEELLVQQRGLRHQPDLRHRSWPFFIGSCVADQYLHEGDLGRAILRHQAPLASSGKVNPRPAAAGSTSLAGGHIPQR